MMHANIEYVYTEPFCERPMCGHLRSKHYPIKIDSITYWSGCWSCANGEFNDFGNKHMCLQWNSNRIWTTQEIIAGDIDKLFESFRHIYRGFLLVKNAGSSYMAALSGATK